MTVSKPRDSASVWMSGTYKAKTLQLNRAVVRERLSKLTETTIEFSSNSSEVDINDILGSIMSLHADNGEGDDGHVFTGMCISVESLGVRDTRDYFVAEVRPWFWMLTLTRNTRVFQDRTLKEIVSTVLREHGFADFDYKEPKQPPKREYCVQYRETDFDFLSRLMEEEGMYYFFDSTKAVQRKEKLIFGHDIGVHPDIAGNPKLIFKPRDPKATYHDQNITEWAAEENMIRGKVKLTDYDFEKPTIRNEYATRTVVKKKNDMEFYDTPGHFRSDRSRGEKFVSVRMQADEVNNRLFRGAGNVRTMRVGVKFKLTEHDVRANNAEYLVIEATHYFQDAAALKSDTQWRALEGRNLNFPKDAQEDYSFVITSIPKATPFRAPLTTPWPQVPGLQTGVVVGGAGDDIHTDEYGRIRVLFRWDMRKRDDLRASCFIRVVTPWAGTGWGVNAVPRVGQEVVIQFEDGDPDRPIVTGMLFNADNMPPYIDRENPTRTGIMTRSSPSGGESDYNALVFEDKAGEEYLHMQAQKDYQMVVKDSASIKVGVKNAEVDPKKQSDVAEGSLNITVQKDYVGIVEEGDKTTTVKKGNYTSKVKKGNYVMETSLGDITVEAKAGEITLKALKKMTLECGQSKIELTPTGIKISALKTDVMGNAMVEIKGAMVKIN